MKSSLLKHFPVVIMSKTFYCRPSTYCNSHHIFFFALFSKVFCCCCIISETITKECLLVPRLPYLPIFLTKTTIVAVEFEKSALYDCVLYQMQRLLLLLRKNVFLSIMSSPDPEWTLAIIVMLLAKVCGCILTKKLNSTAVNLKWYFIFNID